MRAEDSLVIRLSQILTASPGLSPAVFRRAFRPKRHRRNFTTFICSRTLRNWGRSSIFYPFLNQILFSSAVNVWRKLRSHPQDKKKGMKTEKTSRKFFLTSKKILPWANVCFRAHAIAQPCRHTTSKAFQAVKRLCDIYTILNLKYCKCAWMRFHCANALVVLCSWAQKMKSWQCFQPCCLRSKGAIISWKSTSAVLCDVATRESLLKRWFCCDFE